MVTGQVSLALRALRARRFHVWPPLAHYPIASTFLGREQVRVRLLDELERVLDLTAQARDPDRNRYRDERVLELELGRLHELADLLGELHRVVVIDLREHDRELL